MDSSENFFAVYRQFGYAPSQSFASHSLYFGTFATQPKTVTGSVKQCVLYYEFICTNILNIKRTVCARLYDVTALPKTLPVLWDVTFCRLANSYPLFLGCWILKFKHCNLPKRR